MEMMAAAHTALGAASAFVGVLFAVCVGVYFWASRR